MVTVTQAVVCAIIQAPLAPRTPYTPYPSLGGKGAVLRPAPPDPPPSLSLAHILFVFVFLIICPQNSCLTVNMCCNFQQQVILRGPGIERGRSLKRVLFGENYIKYKVMYFIHT